MDEVEFSPRLKSENVFMDASGQPLPTPAQQQQPQPWGQVPMSAFVAPPAPGAAPSFIAPGALEQPAAVQPQSPLQASFAAQMDFIQQQQQQHHAAAAAAAAAAAHDQLSSGQATPETGSIAGSGSRRSSRSGAGSPRGNMTEEELKKKQRRAQQFRESSRKYRRRKKEYVEDLETRLFEMTLEMDNLRRRHMDTVSELQSVKEVQQPVAVSPQQHAQASPQQPVAPPVQAAPVGFEGLVQTGAETSELNAITEEHKALMHVVEDMLISQIPEPVLMPVVEKITDNRKRLFVFYKNQVLARFDPGTVANSGFWGQFPAVGSGTPFLSPSTIWTGSNFMEEGQSVESAMWFWEHITATLGLSPEQMSALRGFVTAAYKNVRLIRTERVQLMAKLQENARKLIKADPNDVTAVVDITNDLSLIKANWDLDFGTWAGFIDQVRTMLSITQLAHMYVANAKHLEKMSVINVVWMTLNQDALQATPASFASLDAGAMLPNLQQ